MKEIFNYDISGVTVTVIQTQNPPYVNINLLDGFKTAVSEYLCYPQHIIAPRIDKYSNIAFVCDEMRISEIKPEIICETTKNAILSYLEANPDKTETFVNKYITKPYIKSSIVDDWVCELKKQASQVITNTTITDGAEMQWVEFDCASEKLTDKFYGRYKNENSNVLLVSLPGYQAEWNDLSEYYNLECDILQLSPLGYNTPSGYDFSKRVNGAWPVLQDTVTKIDFLSGYNKWFLECIVAINAFLKDGQKLVFIGTSQGGGAALILSSIFRYETVGCAAEMPFLIGFSDKHYNKVRGFAASNINNPERIIYDFYAKERLYCIDPKNHTHRLKARTLFVAGEKDTECPSEDIFNLYKMLSCTKEYMELKGMGHGYTDNFKEKAKKFIKTEIGGTKDE